jgi:hypothetical protein
MAPSTTEREFVPLPGSIEERNPDRWILAELRRIFKWGARVLTYYGQHKRSAMAATFAECLSAAAAVIEGRLQV